jgi:tRNA dimethylallyltransferase
MQIYRRMDIGTAKPTQQDMAEIPHHLIDICEPNENFSAADFSSKAREAIANVRARGKMPVLCGGTGLYLDSVLKGVSFGEMETDPQYRSELFTFAEREGADALHERLRSLDPDAADAIHPNNVKRVIRALEICRFSGMTKTEWDKKAIEVESPYHAAIIALDYKNRDLLYERIERRVDEMMESGLVQEASSLFRDGLLTPDSTAGGAIGYKELLGYLNGTATYDDAVLAIKTATRRYAKRQLTWLRRNTGVHWLFPDEYPTKEALRQDAFAIIERILGNTF